MPALSHPTPSPLLPRTHPTDATKTAAKTNKISFHTSVQDASGGDPTRGSHSAPRRGQRVDQNFAHHATFFCARRNCRAVALVLH